MPLLTFGCGLPILAYAFGRFTLVDGKVFMRPLLAFTFTVIMLYFFQRCLFGPLLVPLMTITDFLPAKMRFILVMAMALAFQPLYLGFAYGINRFLFKFPYDDRRVVDEISSALVSVHEAGTLFARLTGILLRTLRPESCAGYLLKDRLFRRHNPTEAVDALPESLGEEELLIAALRRQPRVLVAEDLLLRAADAEVILGHAMLTQGIAVAMPLLVDEQLRGCLLLSEKKSGDAYLRADVRVLQVMSRYGGLALENVRYYAELQRLNTNLEECVTQRTADLDRAIVLLKEADKAKDSFLAVVSHELRNPMTTISGFAEMGLMGAESAASKRAFAKILHGVQLQTRMVMDLIDISRIVHGKLILEPQPTDLWALTVATMEQLEQRFLTKEITLIMHPPTPAELPVLADPARLEQVLSNLVGNAIKFGVEHGTVTITGGADARGCWLTVQDNGKGISAKDLPHIFTLFHQKIGDEQLGGLGVGLGLVQGIMALHYGSVIAASPGAGQGATFTIALPHADAAAQAYTSASQPTVEREKGCV
jgi:signal transduction histidine kinase